MTTHNELVETATPIKGTPYWLNSYSPKVGLSAKPKLIWVLILNGRIIDQGSKADLLLGAKSAKGTPLGACHIRYEKLSKGESVK